MVPWAHPSPKPKWHLDRFSRFCIVHHCDRSTDRPTNHATQSVTIVRIYVRSAAMRPNLLAANYHELAGPRPNSITLAGSKLVRSWFETGSKLVEPVCDQLRTSFEPASLMEFGFYRWFSNWSSPRLDYCRLLCVDASNDRQSVDELRHR